MNSDLLPSVIIPTSPYANELVEHLLPHAEMKIIPARKKLFLTIGDENFCYLLTSGQATLHKEENNLVLATVTGPTLVGLGQLPEQTIKGYLKPLASCEIGVISHEKVLAVVEEHNLWKTATHHMIVVFNKLYAINQHLTARTSYALVRAQLNELMNEDISIRNSISAERYVRDKTNLSRSGIMRILSALREGGYIELSRGFLQKVNALPEKF